MSPYVDTRRAVPLIGRCLPMIVRCTLLSLLVALSALMSAGAAVAAAPRANSVDLARIDAFVAGEMQANRIPGLALGLVHGDQIMQVRGFGTSDQAGHPVTPHTQFLIGSVTKSFTALAIMQLVEAGKVELDAPVQHYLPWFRVADPTASAKITVRELLNHTRGLPNNPAIEDQVVLMGDTHTTLEQLVRGLSTVPLDRPVGSSFEYANTNYCTLGVIIGAVSGESYAAYVQDHIFAPLQMIHSYASVHDDLRAGLAQGHKWYFGLPFATDMPIYPSFVPAGFIASNVEDMSHYLIAQLNAGRYEGATVLSSSGIAAMHTPVVTAKKAGRDTSYGMGWFVGPLGGVPALYHGGDAHNYHSEMILEPQNGWGAILLVNADSFLGDPVAFDRLQNGLARMLAGQEPPAAGVRIGTFYLIIDIALVMLTVLAVLSAARLPRWYTNKRRHPRHLWLRMAGRMLWEVVLPGLLLVSVPQVVGYSWWRIGLSMPDVFYWLLAVLVLVLLSGIMRLALAVILSVRNTPEPAAASGSTPPAPLLASRGP